MRKVCVFTGTRAEYGLLKPLMQEIQSDTELLLQVIASGMHLSPEFGLTYKEIEKDGFRIDEKVEILMSSDSPIGACKSIGLGLIGCAEALERLRPDIMVLLGDRSEAFAAASSAMMCRLPIAHLHGGESTFGVMDEAIRHSITKMSHLHFTSTEDYRQRVIQLGESPDKVFNVGAIGIENIRKTPLLSRHELEDRIGFSFGESAVLVTYHPVTLECSSAKIQFQALLDALDSFSDLKIILTKANADIGGRIINEMIDSYAAENREKAAVFTSMGQLLYLSTMRHVHAVLGNSSSGIIEAPSLGVPTVNIGNRQEGRVKCESVIDCLPIKADIIHALERALSWEFRKEIQGLVNPYEKKDTILAIKEIIKSYELEGILKKVFYDFQF